MTDHLNGMIQRGKETYYYIKKTDISPVRENVIRCKFQDLTDLNLQYTGLVFVIELFPDSSPHTHNPSLRVMTAAGLIISNPTLLWWLPSKGHDNSFQVFSVGVTNLFVQTSHPALSMHCSLLKMSTVSQEVTPHSRSMFFQFEQVELQKSEDGLGAGWLACC